MPIRPLTVAVDLGKSRCRVAVDDGTGRDIRSDAGVPGLATRHGVDAAASAVLALLDGLGPIDRLAVGAAGAWTAPDAAEELARTLAERTHAPVAVTSDVVAAHAGALHGAFGTLLIAGTGAASLGVDADGVRLVDGWGPELGDLGGGSWLGREGIRATLMARDGLGPETDLTRLIGEHMAPDTECVRWLAGSPATARRLATVAPIVLDAAAAGDPSSAGIVTEAIRLLTRTAVAASATLDVAVHGGLTEHAWFRSGLERALIAAGCRVVPAIGDAFDGAALLALHTDMPHERFVHRAE